MSVISSEYLRSQRDRPAVLKTDLARIRSAASCALVFVVEGTDDLLVYEVWLQRIAPMIKWEPLVANGKKNVLAFREMMRRDKTELGICTYFIVDHDYDGLRGQQSGSDIYVLPAHSVENFLAAPDVLESILRSDLQVLGDPELRHRIVALYKESQNIVCEALVEPCARLFGANGVNVGNIRIAESSLQGFAINAMETSIANSGAIAGLVTSEQVVPADRVQTALDFFARFDLAMWIRGKFLLALLREWVDLLLADRKSDRPQLFPTPAPSLKLSPASIDIRSLSSKSDIPQGLMEFVTSASEECLRTCKSA